MPRSFAAAPRRETVSYRNQPLAYTLVFRARRSIGFAVRPDGSVHVSAPAGISTEWVAQQVLKRADWILRHQAEFARRPAPVPARHYEAGSPHYYRGRPYPLRFAEGRPAVSVADDALTLSAPQALTAAQAEDLLNGWYVSQAGALFAESFERVWPRFAGFNLAPPKLFVRHMRTRWGSCTPRTGRIRLSSELIRARPECLDYVVLHECCHLLVGDHSKAFYALQTRLLPDWERWKTELNALPRL